MTSNIGYIRVSSNNQNTDRQLDGIVLDKTFTEKQSGKSSNDRPQLQECLSWIREGDTLHIHSIDRLARNLVDLQNLVTSITAKGVTLKFHKEGLTFTGDSNNPMNQLLLQMLGAVAEFERNLIKERQAEGIRVAREKGVKFGAKPKLSDEQISELKLLIQAGRKVTEVAKQFGITRPTVYKHLSKSLCP
ncbi:MAG: recombinase family protein [Methylococcaceae bacterium]